MHKKNAVLVAPTSTSSIQDGEMDGINSVAGFINTSIVTPTNVAIFVAILVVIVRMKSVSPDQKLSGVGNRTMGWRPSGWSSPSPDSRAEDMRRVRLRQQALSDERAAQAAKVRKARDENERERKNHVARGERPGGSGGGGGGTGRSGGGGGIGRSGGYNPMNPGSSRGYRYVDIVDASRFPLVASRAHDAKGRHAGQHRGDDPGSSGRFKDAIRLDECPRTNLEGGPTLRRIHLMLRPQAGLE